MTGWTAVMLMAALSADGRGPAPARAPAAPPTMVVTQMLIRQRTIVRIPTKRAPAPAGISEWRERKGPKCVGVDRVVAAAVVKEDSVDLLLRGGDRVRAEFDDDCPDLDYYGGFYLGQGGDGRVCADRDSVRARSGGECRIDRFRALEARPAGARREGVLARIRRRLGR